MLHSHLGKRSKAPYELEKLESEFNNRGVEPISNDFKYLQKG